MNQLSLNNIPKTYDENIKFRHKLLTKCRDPHFKAMVKELFHRDIIFAYNAFFYTLDVRKRPRHHQPFCTYPYQDVFILDLVDRIESATHSNPRDLASDKSRDMGASWMFVTTFLWFWLKPVGGYDFLLGSRIEDYVDKKGDMRTLFEKARYAFYKLPKWLWPKNYNKRVHDNYMKLLNPETGASITGESNNPNFSTGGRYAAILFDEFPKWESTDVAAWTAAADASPCRFPTGTPFGAAGQHYELMTDPIIDTISLHWSLHPDKAEGLYCVWPKPELAGDVVDHESWEGLRSPWYDAQSNRRSPLEVAQELDIDYIGAGNPVFDGASGKRISLLLKSKIEAIKWLSWDEYAKKPSLTEVAKPDSSEGYVVIYKEPDIRSSYIVACDVAEGKIDGDYAVVKVLERASESLVASFAAQVDEITLARILAAITKYYTVDGAEPPWWAVETNGPGLATFDIVVEEYDLENGFMMMKFDVAKQEPSYRKGWWTSTPSRRSMIGGIKSWLLAGEGWVDKRCCREMTTFVVGPSGKAEAKSGAHDDEVMAWGIALQVNKLVPFEEFEEPQELRYDGLPKDVFGPNMRKIEEPSMEERCYATAVARRYDDGLDTYRNDLIDSMFEQI